jgi:hypothetical protein
MQAATSHSMHAMAVILLDVDRLIAAGQSLHGTTAH